MHGAGAAEVRTVADLARMLRELRRRHARRLGRAEPTYRELAKATGWSHGIIGEYLAGRVLPPTDRFDVLIRLLGATPAEQGALATARDRVEEGRRRAASVTGTGAGTGAGRDTARSAVPQQLPMDVFGFTGRGQELDELDAIALARDVARPGAEAVDLGRAVVISAVSGTAGIGKTALAVHWAHRVAHHFPDGQLYIDLRGYDPEQPVRPDEALARLLRGLGISGPDLPADLAERAACYRTALARRRMLVVLDNASDADQVRLLLPGASSCFVLITSRDDLAGLVARDGARRIRLGQLTADESITLLRTLIGPRVDEDAAAAQELAERCTHLPLALRIAAELATASPHSTPADLLADLRDEQRSLDVLGAAGDPRTAVRSVFSWSYQHLTAAGARAFALVGLHPGREFDLHCVAALADTGLDQARATADELRRAHLIDPLGHGRFAMHDLLRAYAAERAVEHLGADDRHAALSRLFDYYLGTAAAAMDTLFPHERRSRPAVPLPKTPSPPVGDRDSAVAWLDRERGSLVAVALYAARHGWAQYCVNLSCTLWRAFEVGGHYQEALAVHTSAVQAALDVGMGRGAVLANLGGIHWMLGSHREAQTYFEQALRDSRKIGDLDSEARVLARLGLVHERLGDYQLATTQLEQSLALYRTAANRYGEAAQLVNLGDLRRRLGDYAEAADLLAQAAAIFVEIGEVRLEGYALGNLGLVHSLAGRQDEALVQLERSLENCRRANDRGGEGSALGTIGGVYARMKRYAQALEYLHGCLAISRETGERSLETETLNALGETLRAMGESEAALARNHAALELAEESGDSFEQARALGGIAEASDAAGRRADALDCWQRALTIYQQLGVPEQDAIRARMAGAGSAERVGSADVSPAESAGSAVDGQVGRRRGGG